MISTKEINNFKQNARLVIALSRNFLKVQRSSNPTHYCLIKPDKYK